jgi:uncharacterized membrane protein
MWTAALTALAIIATALGSGVLFGVALANVPGFLALPADAYVRTHQLFDRHYEPIMPVLVLSAMAADVLVAIGPGGPAQRLEHVVAAVLLAAVALISVRVNVPLLRGVRQADPAALPPDWTDPRPRWRTWNLARTVLAVLALVITTIAVVTR